MVGRMAWVGKVGGGWGAVFRAAVLQCFFWEIPMGF